MKFLDCTLRDGGYYTNWDFEPELVKLYLEAMEMLPVDILEVGYRSKGAEGYFGEYFHLPAYRLEKIRQLAPSKKIAVMLNEKDCTVDDLDQLIMPVKDLIDIVRLAVKPERFEEAIKLGREIKKQGLEVAFNLMYMSSLIGNDEMTEKMKNLDGEVEYFNLVDSYGGVYPNQVKEYFKELRPQFLNTKLGYHGHNNLELGFANSLAAVENGCDIVDGTLTGMGRGAGNLKTELWLTWLSTEKGIEVDFNALSSITHEFEQMQKNFDWGTRLAYMVSGANSLPQKDVMDWVTTRSYSLNSIIQTLHNQKAGKKDNINLPVFNEEQKNRKAIIVGGGKSVAKHIDAIISLLKKRPDDYCLIHASSTNARLFQDVNLPQYYCLVGNEGHRLERVLESFDQFHGKCVLPAYPRKMGTYIPRPVRSFAYELEKVDFTDKYVDSHTALALQTALSMQISEVYVIGYDGYQGAINQKEQDLYNENEYLFKMASEKLDVLKAITPSRYRRLEKDTIYLLLMQTN